LDASPGTAVAMRTLAYIYIAQGELAKAKPMAEEAVKRFRHAMGDHMAALTGLLALARVDQLEGRYDQAAPLLQEAQGMCRRLQMDEGPRPALMLGMLGENLVAKGNYLDAETPLRRCLEVWERRLPYGGEYTIGLSRQGAAREYAFAK